MGLMLKRLTVGLIALILLIIAIVSLAVNPASAWNIVLNVLVIAISVMGLLGVWYMHPTYLGIFMLLLVVLCILQIAYIIWAAVTNAFPARQFAWQIVEAVILLIGAIFTADLRRASYGHPSGTWTGRKHHTTTVI